MAEKSVLPELEQLARNIGEFIQYWGFKRIHGQIWTHLFVSDEPLDAGELIRRLGVSKALISMSLSELAEYDVIKDCGKGPKNTVIYSANKDVTSVITNVLRRREKQMISQVDAACRLVRDLPEGDKKAMKLSDEQLASLNDLIANAQAGLAALLSFDAVDMSFWSDLSSGAGELNASSIEVHDHKN